MRYLIDSSDRTHLPICCSCGWRGEIWTTRDAAKIELIAHQRRAHPGESESIRANFSRCRRAKLRN